MSYLTSLSDAELEAYRGNLEMRERKILNASWLPSLGIVGCVLVGLGGLAHVLVNGLRGSGLADYAALAIGGLAVWYGHRIETEQRALRVAYRDCAEESSRRKPIHF